MEVDDTPATLVPRSARIMILALMDLYPNPPKKWSKAKKFIKSLRSLERSVRLVEHIFIGKWGDNLFFTRISFHQLKMRLRHQIFISNMDIKHKNSGGCHGIPCNLMCIRGLLGSEVKFIKDLGEVLDSFEEDIQDLLFAINE